MFVQKIKDRGLLGSKNMLAHFYFTQLALSL